MQLPGCEVLFVCKTIYKIVFLSSYMLIQMSSDIISSISYHGNITIANIFSFTPNIDYSRTQSETADILVIALSNAHILSAMSWAPSSLKTDLAPTPLQIRLHISMLK